MSEAFGLSRRTLLAAAATAGLPGWLRADAAATPVLRWKLDDGGDFATESISGERDAIASRTGHAIWSGEGKNRALRFDGYSVWLRHASKSPLALGDAMTVTAWVALETYPVSEAALLQMDAKGGTVFQFSIDRFGYLQCAGHAAEAKSVCRAIEPVGKGRWVHVAASMGRHGITLYRDGVAVGSSPNWIGRFDSLEAATFVLGLSPDCSTIADVFETGVLNGLMREVLVFDREVAVEGLARMAERSRPAGAPDLELNGAWCVDDPQRPICHAQPPRAWTNEPYGLIRFGGQYHIFYQKNPDGPYWSRLHWGHMTSPDLLRWTEMPVALAPELPYESKGCWSGSAIEHEGKLALVYTGVDEVKAGICLAFSEDGVEFTKHLGNPVISSPPQGGDYLDFRDPFVWREGEVYYLIAGAGVKDVGGTVLLYRSKDLVGWEFLRQMYKGEKSVSGPFFEMPIFFKEGDRHALVVSELPGRASYWVGDWRDERFAPVSPVPRHLELFNHLLSPTPLIEPDGQVVVMGIIPDERPARQLWRAGWAHLYSLPRVLSIGVDGTLEQRPHACLDRLCRPLACARRIDLQGGSVQELPGVAETSLRVRARLNRGASTAVSLLLRRSPDGREQTEIAYDWEQARLTLDRTKSSLDPRVRRDREETEYASAVKDSIGFDVFVDRSVLEVFVDGRAAFAARIYPTLAESAGVAFVAAGTGAVVDELSLARLERPAVVATKRELKHDG